MKYRSYNSEIIIATTLLIDIFNDIIIDRRKHGLNRDFSKPISFDEIIQQQIEIPCILGDRGIILKSLENEPGKYKLPLIILQNKSLKTDVNRMFDLHNDVFYQLDNQFSNLSVSHHLYKQQEMWKKRGQPVILDFDMTIITKYKEDLDQILSNWAVHFRPDVYVKWWHPRNKLSPLTSQILWSHNISFDSPVEYNPQNIFTYKLTTSFSFKSWLFYGIHSDTYSDNYNNGFIKKIKLFPNRTIEFDDNDLITGEKDVNDFDDIYVFGDIKHTNESDLSFFGLETGQEFIGIHGKDDDKIKNGKFMVNNVFSENDSLISGDQILREIKNNQYVGDFFSNYDKYLINSGKKYYKYITFDNNDINVNSQAIIKNVYFKGGFLQEDMTKYPPSGDFLFNTFYKKYDKYNKSFTSEFGQSFLDMSKINISYDINSKNLFFTSKYSDNKYTASFKNILNSSYGIIQEFSLETKLNIKKIGLLYHNEFDKNFNEKKGALKFEKYNINIFNGQFGINEILLKAHSNSHKQVVMKILNLIKSLWNSINLVEKSEIKYDMEFEDQKFKDILYEKGLEHYNFRIFTLIKQEYFNDFYYYVLCNEYIYIVLKVNVNDKNNVDIYDIGPYISLELLTNHEILYEITIPESKMLLGLNFSMKY